MREREREFEFMLEKDMAIPLLAVVSVIGLIIGCFVGIYKGKGGMF